MNIDNNKFDLEGFTEPFKMLDLHECKKILREKYIPKKNYTWMKSVHEKSFEIAKLASRRNLVDKVKQTLGSDIILWGSCLINQGAGNQHSWHCDLEFENWDGVTIWIGLKNLNEKTPLSLISHSHKIDTFPQKLVEKKINLENDKEILDEAKKLNTNCEMRTFKLKAGEAIMWSGRVWHKTINLSTKPRESIILQFASPKNKIKIPVKYDYKNMEWLDKNPPCLLVSGEDKYGINKIIKINDLKINNKLISFIEKNIFFFRYLLSKAYYKIKKFKF